MTMIVQDTHTSAQFSSLLVPLRRLYDVFIAARQSQAGGRTALYMREVPDDVLFKLGVSVAELERLRGGTPAPRADASKSPSFLIIGKVRAR